MSQPEGITNHPASVEAAEDAKLKTPAPPENTAPNSARDKANAEKDLPTGMAEKVETVNPNTMTTHK